MSKVSSLSRNRQQRRKARVIDPALAIPPLEDQVRHMGAGQLRRLPNTLGQAVLLEWLGQSPIAFHRVYVDLTGGVLPALWLSNAMDRVSRASAPSSFEANGDYVFAMSANECELATGITRSQQAGCRKQLIELGFLSEHAVQRKATVYRLHLNCVARRLLANSASLAEKLQAYEPLPMVDMPDRDAANWHVA